MIRSDRLLYELAPDNFGERCCESWSSWRVKAHEALPEFPDDVLEQWIFRHWKGVLCHWGWLDFQAMRFERQVWTTENALKQINAPFDDAVDLLVRRMGNSVVQRSWLVQEMREKGTWPSAPIILNYPSDLETPNGHQLKAPFNLLEGYHRYSYLKAMVAEGEPVAKEHVVWVVTLVRH